VAGKVAEAEAVVGTVLAAGMVAAVRMMVAEH